MFPRPFLRESPSVSVKYSHTHTTLWVTHTLTVTEGVGYRDLWFKKYPQAILEYSNVCKPLNYGI